MAEAALKAELKRRKIAWYTVQSAGLRAETGSEISPNSAQALTEAGIPVPKAFKSRQLTNRMIQEAYAVVCMTEYQRRALSKYPNVTCFAAICGRDIPDPYGQSIDEYRVTLRRIREGLPRIIAALHIGEDENGG